VPSPRLGFAATLGPLPPARSPLPRFRNFFRPGPISFRHLVPSLFTSSPNLGFLQAHLTGDRRIPLRLPVPSLEMAQITGYLLPASHPHFFFGRYSVPRSPFIFLWPFAPFKQVCRTPLCLSSLISSSPLLTNHPSPEDAPRPPLLFTKVLPRSAEFSAKPFARFPLSPVRSLFRLIYFFTLFVVSEVAPCWFGGFSVFK